jgi:hypothetical protein
VGGDSQEGEAISPAALRRRVKRFRESVVTYIDPEMAPGRLPEMGCLDSNRCFCLLLKAREILRSWARTPLEDLDPKSCRLNPRSRLDALHPASATPSILQAAPQVVNARQAARTIMGQLPIQVTRREHIEVAPPDAW